MTRISDTLAEGRTLSFEFFPPKTDGAPMRWIGEAGPGDPAKPLKIMLCGA